jgi:DNA-directed RNA polymerase specialized sigma24 family protein
MVATERRELSSRMAAWHADFLAILPAIRRHARFSFRNAAPELRQELVQETIANSLANYARLAELGKHDVAFPSALARYAVAQVRAGRRIGNRLQIGDVLSEFAQRKKCFSVERLDYYDGDENCWLEIVVEDRRASPADVAACRIDFASWLTRLPSRLRKMALFLAAGETTSATARKFGVTPARISQIRQWFKKSWEAFHGEINASEEPRFAVA